MILRLLLPPFIFIPIMIAQIYFIPIIEISGIVPNLLIILIAYYTLQEGQLFGMVFAFFVGFIFDLSTGSIIGASMLSGVIAAFSLGFFYNENKADSYIRNPFFPLFVLLGCFINSAIFNLIANFNVNLSFSAIILFSAFLPALYTAFLGAVAALIFDGLGVRKRIG